MAPIPPASLVRYLRKGRCVLFAGSGLSAWAGLPTWNGLLKHFVNEIRAEEPDSPHLPDLDALLEAGKLLEVADYCKDKLGARRYSEVLAELLRGATGDVPEPHKVIAQLPFSAVVTTNYDKLLERAYATIPRTPTHADIGALGPLLFNDSFFIMKAHGDIDRPETLILTARDYREIIHSSPAFAETFSAILLTNAILFVGYSLSDPDFRLLLDRQLAAFKEYVPDRYALMSGVSQVEQDVLWRTARIRVLSYPDGEHDEVLAFLEDLKTQVERAAAPKPELAAAPPQAAVQPLDEARHPTRIPTSTLSIRPRGQQVECAVASGDDMVAVHGKGQAINWKVLSELLRDSVGWAGASAQDVGQALADVLPAHVLVALGDVPPDDVISLRLAPEVEPLPWEWVQAQGNYLCLQHPVVRAPIGVSDEARGYPLVRQPIRVLLIGDTTDRIPLPGARAEVEAIGTLYQAAGGVSCEMLVGHQATFEAVVHQLLTGDYDVIHFAGHAWYDPQEAYLTLHNEVILHASELRSLLSPRPPAVLVLNSHFTAFVPPGVRLDDEQTAVAGAEGARMASMGRGKGGFTDVASTTGVGAFVGCLGSPSDQMAKEIGFKLHAELLKGVPIAVALHTVRLAAAVRGGRDHTWLHYALSGYPELTLR